jgi:hypothetical protein
MNSLQEREKCNLIKILKLKSKRKPHRLLCPHIFIFVHSFISPTSTCFEKTSCLLQTKENAIFLQVLHSSYRHLSSELSNMMGKLIAIIPSKDWLDQGRNKRQAQVRQMWRSRQLLCCFQQSTSDDLITENGIILQLPKTMSQFLTDLNVQYMTLI